MKRNLKIVVIILFLLSTGCSTSYKAKPLPLQTPAAYPNNVEIEGCQIGAKAFDDATAAKEAFGFNILGAGLLPVQVVLDNKGNLWPILSNKIAYERTTKYAETNKIFKEGAYGGFLGAAAGSLIGGAVGIVTGQNIAESVGKGAAVGGATGAVLGGAKGYGSNEARRDIISDLQEKSLENKPVEPSLLGYGFLFFPAEAGSTRYLRLQIRETDTGKVHTLKMAF